MPKVKLLKNLNGNKQGDIIDVTNDRLKYFIRVGIATSEYKPTESKDRKIKGRTDNTI